MLPTPDKIRKALAKKSLEHWSRLAFPDYRVAAFHAKIIDALERVERGEQTRLMIFCPPRMGKTLLTSINFPAWFLGRNPDKRVLIASYGAALAHTNSRQVRNLLLEFGEEIFGVQVAEDSAARDHWNIQNRLGGLRAVGVDGPATGAGADLCFVGSTLVSTNIGKRPISSLKVGDLVWTHSHETCTLELKPVEATKVSYKAVIRVRTHSGRELLCTKEHPIFSEGAYREAHTLTSGALIVRMVQEGGNQASFRYPKGTKEQQCRCLLQRALLGATPCGEKPSALRGVSETSSKEDNEVLQCNVSTEPQENRTEAVPVWKDISAEKFEGAALLACVCRCDTLQSDDWRGKLPLQECGQLCEVVRDDASANIGAGQGCVCSVSHARGEDSTNVAGKDSTSFEFGSSPHKPQTERQQSDKLNNPMFEVSPVTSPLAVDAVSVVTSGGDLLVPVYDIQVAENHNFFAEEILVHNCVVDDPVKDQADALSETERNNKKDWYRSVLRTRLHPGGRIVLMHTRWHEDDLAGWLLKEAANGGEQWEVISFPMVDDEGALLWPERYDLEACEAIKKAVGSAVWEALYQQRPTNLEGGLFKRAWWKYHNGNVNSHAQWGASVDCAFKGGPDADYVVIQIWARHLSNRYLIDQVRKQMDFVATCAEIRRLAEQYPQCQEWLIENTANGPAVISTLRSVVPGIIPINPGTKAKEARAAAISPLVEAGQVFLPEGAPWLDAFLSECSAFPKGRNDDQVDALSQALNRWRVGGGFHLTPMVGVRKDVAL